MERPKRSLQELLHQTEEFNDEVEEESNEAINTENCIECGDQPRELHCVGCDEDFCQVCFDYLHRTGKRKLHETQKLAGGGDVDMEPVSSGLLQHPDSEAEKTVDTNVDAPTTASVFGWSDPQAADSNGCAEILKMSQFVPLRLTMEERQLFRLLVAALDVSEYTDRVDVYAYSAKAKRIVRELREICTVLTGLAVANGLEAGKKLVDEGDFAANADWFQTVFEIGRRYKIMNPERMRNSYGKLVYMIMDSRLPEIRQVLEFDLYKPVLTVHRFLELKNKLEVLQDPRIVAATAEVSAHGKSRPQIQRAIKTKEQAIEQLVRQYGEDIRQALYSLGDYHAYLGANQAPVGAILNQLKTNFDPESPSTSAAHNLGIRSGRNGARLTHDHQKQYQYVLQSLTLWYEIMGDMFLLWKLADDDLLAEKSRYRLEDTGQGLNRVKSSPQVSRSMHTIISRAQRKTGRWVGSSVVHLGDRAVPNSLFFLDKYLQVPRILNPVQTTLELLPGILDSDKYAADWVVSQFNSTSELQLCILADFFRYAFDGSGADNFYDAGSCIDGRLTSAWNWANKLPKKSYYKYFLISGFIGFDGAEGF